MSLPQIFARNFLLILVRSDFLKTLREFFRIFNNTRHAFPRKA